MAKIRLRRTNDGWEVVRYTDNKYGTWKDVEPCSTFLLALRQIWEWKFGR